MGRKTNGRAIHRLTSLAIQKLSRPGMHADGGNLYLNVAAGGSKSWVFRYYAGGKQREMGLGSLLAVDVARAREEARVYREQLQAGLDPLQTREQRKRAELLRAAEDERAKKTWKWCCETYVSTVKVPELSNPKHAAQWGTTLETYTYPDLGERYIDTIGLDDVHQVLARIWLEKNETASRVRQRMESVFSWAKVKGYRRGDNPAAWKGALDHLLAKPAKVQQERHHPALPYSRGPEFMRELQRHGGVAARALEFLVLTAQRTNPIIEMEWAEVDFERRVWESPPAKMKMDYPHRTPLSHRALDLLQAMKAQANGSFVFQRAGQPLSNAAMNMAINKGMAGYEPAFVDPKEGSRRITPHGFRSTFKDWCAETTDYSHELSEAALAHSKGDKTVQAYLRADMLERRRPLMQAWADYLYGQKSALPKQG